MDFTFPTKNPINPGKKQISRVINEPLKRKASPISIKSNAETFKDKWVEIDTYLRLAISPQRPLLDGMILYQKVYSLCCIKPKPCDSLLYASLESFIVEEVGKIKHRIINSSDLLETYKVEWLNYKIFTKIVQTIFSYLDRIIVNSFHHSYSSFNRIPIIKMLMKAWKELVLCDSRDNFKNILVSAFVSSINSERSVQISSINTSNVDINQSNSNFISENCNLFVATFYECDTDDGMFFYKEEIEQIFMKECLTFYSQRLDSVIRSISLPNFLFIMSKWLDIESRIVVKYLHSTSYSQIISKLHEELICFREKEAVNGFLTFLLSDDYANLQNMHRLFFGTEGGSHKLAVIFEKFVIDKGNESFLKISTLSSKVVFKVLSDSLNQLKCELNNLITNCFNNDFNFIAAVEKAFRSLINRRIKTVAYDLSDVSKLLEMHLEYLIANSSENRSLEIDNFFSLFKYVDDKESFIQSYSYNLANRLIRAFLSGGSIDATSFDSFVIGKMKEMCGTEYIGKVSKMLSDVLSCHPYESHKISFSSLLLTHNIWPKYPLHDLLDSEIRAYLSQNETDLLDSFESKYRSSFQGRKISWYLSLSTLSISYGKAKLFLPLTHFIILRLLQSNAKFTKESLQQRIKFPANILKVILSDLINFNVIALDAKNQYRIIMKDSPISIKIPLPSIFDFAHSSITSATIQTSVEQSDNWNNEDKRSYVQSVIVRVVKKERMIIHSLLVARILEACSKSHLSSPPPPVSLIKQCIEQLIEKQYIERDPCRNDRYLYVA